MTGRLFPILCVAVALMALTACNPLNTGTAAQSTAPPDLAKAAHDRDEAVDKADSATWDRLTTPDFTLVDDSGRFMSKVERIAEIKASKPAVSPNPCQQEQFQVSTVVSLRGVVATEIRGGWNHGSNRTRGGVSQPFRGRQCKAVARMRSRKYSKWKKLRITHL